MDTGAWRVIVHGVTKSQTRLSNLAHTYAEARVWGGNECSILVENVTKGTKGLGLRRGTQTSTVSGYAIHVKS